MGAGLITFAPPAAALSGPMRKSQLTADSYLTVSLAVQPKFPPQH